MAEEKVIKSGVLTIPRILFLAVVGLIIFLTVWSGLLAVGYWIMTLALCVLLFLIIIDYGVKKDVLTLEQGTGQAVAADTDATTPAIAASANAPRVRRRASRPTKRRR